MLEHSYWDFVHILVKRGATMVTSEHLIILTRHEIKDYFAGQQQQLL